MTPLHPDVLAVDDISHAAHALADLFDAHDASTPVPTCGEWTLADLVWHLTAVQLFWGHIIGNRPDGPGSYEQPTRLADVELSAGLRNAGLELAGLLAAAGNQEVAWSWSDDQTVGFTVRRQVHESMIHSIDGFLAVGAPTPEVEPRLAADGIDEMVRVMLTSTPDWANFEPKSDVIELVASDSDDRWFLRSGTLVGTEPMSGKHLELDGYMLDHSAIATVTIAAPAIELLLWMWGRREAPAMSSPSQIDAANALRHAFAAATQ